MQRNIQIIVLILITWGTLRGQSWQPDIYFDCRTSCPMDYIKQELAGTINFLTVETGTDYVVQIRSESIASGTNVLLDLSLASDTVNTHNFRIDQNTAPKGIQEAFVHQIRVLLLPLFYDNPDSRTKLRYHFAEDKKEENGAESEPVDKWKNWIFDASLDASLYKEEVSEFINLGYGLSAFNITENRKMVFSSYYDDNKQSFDYGDTTISESINTYVIEGSFVQNLNSHQGFGFKGALGSDSYQNISTAYALFAAYEHNFFPYSENNDRMFTLLYGIGLRRNNYDETTLFGKTSESIITQSFIAQYFKNADWGSFRFLVSGKHLMNYSDRYRMSFSPTLELRLSHGISVYLYFNYSITRDRIYLPAGALTQEEILLRIKDQDSGYRLSTSVSFNYRFGSKYNNFRNPALGYLYSL